MGTESNYTSPNTGGIKRGDSAETGDLEARPTPKKDLTVEGLGNPLDPGNVLEDLSIKDAESPSLGLTNIAGRPPEDPIADNREPEPVPKKK
jgi:hypothetical protein